VKGISGAPRLKNGGTSGAPWKPKTLLPPKIPDKKYISH
jgi:hypothetical protein